MGSNSRHQLGPWALVWLALVLACGRTVAGRDYQGWRLICAAPALGDPVIAYTDLYGTPNISDSAWHDDTWAFMQYGPITAMSMYYSVPWHDPYIGWHPGGEFKGIQPVYGTNGTNDQDLLFGARRPHKPFNFTLEPGEDITRVELQHDSVMRWMAFTTSLGNKYEWGYPGEPNATDVVLDAPREGAYLAAFRGFEGKQLPPEMGGYTKRYIIQIGFAWAMPKCSGYEPAGGAAAADASGPAPVLAPVVPLGISPSPLTTLALEMAEPPSADKLAAPAAAPTAAPAPAPSAPAPVPAPAAKVANAAAARQTPVAAMARIVQAVSRLAGQSPHVRHAAAAGRR